MEIKPYTAECLDRIRDTVPLVHNITNFVVMNSSANILLALGASPVMAHCIEEVDEMASLSSALVLNIGTLQEDWVESMIVAAKTANSRNIPVILDPVGAGATRLRTDVVERIMDECAVTVVRGNASEVMAVGRTAVKTRGVDSSVSMSEEIAAAAREIAGKKGCVIAVSGEIDCITDGTRMFRVRNGQPIMTRVTGIGCGLSAVTGAFCAVCGSKPIEATAAAFGFYNLCADLAAEDSSKPGSFYTAFLDRLYSTGEEEITSLLDVSESE